MNSYSHSKSIVLRGMALMSSGSLEEFRDVIHQDYINREAKDEPPKCRGRGPEAAFASAVWLASAFADLKWNIHEVAEEGDVVVLHSTMTGRHTVGPFCVYDAQGRVSTAFPPTGKEVATTQTHWFRLRDGQIIEHWANRDDNGTALQLGWVPPSPLYLIRMAMAKWMANRSLV